MNSLSISEFVASKRAWTVCIGLITLLATSLGALILYMQVPDDSLPRFRQRFETLLHMEANWDREILSLQLGIARNFDAVTNAGRSLKLHLAELEATTASDEALMALASAVNAYRKAIERKAWFSEQVKASYAMLRNSVSVLPYAISDSYRNPQILEIIDGVDKRASDLLTEVVTAMVSFTVSPTPLLRDAVQERVTATRNAARFLRPELADTIERFLLQIEVFIKERQRGNEQMLAVTSVPTDSAADRVEARLQSLETASAREQRMLWNLAIALGGMLLLAFVAFVITLSRRFIKLDKDNFLLQQANEDVEEKLMQSTKLSSLGQMVAGITHEINTPLAYVKAVFELIKERMTGEDQLDSQDGPDEMDEDEIRERREELERLLNDGLYGLEEIATLVRTMKNFSRLDKGHIESFSVEEGLENALLIARPQLKYLAEIKREFDSVPNIMGSPSQLRQVLLNLITNAVDAMATTDRRGLLTLRTRVTSSDTVQVDVCDNGPGISEEAIGKIFDPFFTTKPVGEGTGMGLSICYRIIENHGGTVTVNSKPGKGTVFTLTLPRQDEKFPKPGAKSHVKYESSKQTEVA